MKLTNTKEYTTHFRLLTSILLIMKEEMIKKGEGLFIG